KMPACRRTSSYKVSRFFHARLINASLDQEDQTGGSQNHQTGNPDQTNPPETPPTQATPAQTNPPQASSPQAPSTTSPDHTNDQTGSNSNNQSQAVNAQSNPDQQQRIQDEIDVVQNRNTPFADIGDAASGRAGDPGIDRLIVEEGTVGGSVTSLDKIRFSTYAKGLYLFSGTPNGQSK